MKKYSVLRFVSNVWLTSCITAFAGIALQAQTQPRAQFAASLDDGNAHISAASLRRPNGKQLLPRLKITAPAFGATEAGENIRIALQLDRKQDRSRLVVKLNGNNITSRLEASSCNQNSCSISGSVDLSDGLQRGENFLSASVRETANAPGESRRSTFDYQDGVEAGLGNSTVNYEPVSVGIETVNPGGGNPWIQITTGRTMNVIDPVNSFPALPNANNTVSIPYPDAQFGTTCTTVLQAIVLQRQNPSVEEGTACGSTVASVLANLIPVLGRQPTSTDLIILGTTPGNFVPAGFNTSGLGGTDYSALPATLYPQQYMMIGVEGATAGSAHEGYSIQKGSDTPFQYWPILNGTLVKDQNSDYNYVPSDDRMFSVSSGSGDGKTPTGVSIAYQNYTPPSSEAGFWLLVFDRYLLQPINYTTQSPGASWTNCGYDQYNQACGGFYPVSGADNAAVQVDLVNTLINISPRNLVFLVAQGCPYTDSSQASPVLGIAVDSIAGLSYSLPQLNANANKCGYSLVSVNDGAHRNVFNTNAAYSGSQFNGQYGAIQGYLSRTNSGLFDVAGKAQDSLSTDGTLANSIDYTFEQVASSQRQDWPMTDTPGHLAAYHDISYQLLTDLSINETGSHDYDVRYFYSDESVPSKLAGLIDRLDAPGKTAPPNIVVASSWDTATAQDFSDVRTQLQSELQKVSSARGYLVGDDDSGGVRGQLDGEQGNLLGGTVAIAQDINANAVNSGALNANLNGVGVLNMAASFAALGQPIAGLVSPPVGAFFGVVAGAIRLGTSAYALDGGAIPNPETSYDLQLNDLIDSGSDYTTIALAGFDASTDNILTDWGKLNTVGSLTANGDSGWNIPYLTELDGIQSSLIAGTARSMWMDVLPQLYGIRTFFDKPSDDPATYRYWNNGYAPELCQSVYTSVPSNSMVAPSNIANSKQYDMFIMASGLKINNNYSFQVVDSPISKDLGNLLFTSNPVKGVTGGPQTGLGLPALEFYASGPLARVPGAQFSNGACKETNQ